MKFVKKGDGYLEFDSLDNPRMQSYDGKIITKIVKKSNGNVQLFMDDIIVDKDEEKDYTCDNCGRSFKSGFGLMGHKRFCNK